MGFYSNVFGFGIGGILVSVIGDFPGGIKEVLIIVSSLAAVALIVSLLLVRNEPKVRVERKRRVELFHFKDLWRQRYTAYNVVTSSAFLGVAWSFQS